jgi:hypothetical protein
MNPLANLPVWARTTLYYATLVLAIVSIFLHVTTLDDLATNVRTWTDIMTVIGAAFASATAQSNIGD